MPPPTQRRPDRTQANGGNRSRMYNLAGHAHSSGSLLPRSTDVHAASTSATTSAGVANRAVDASDAPYLTNLESHFGRVTLTAPDNLLRKQAAKEKKQKIRQKKAQNAQAAAAALAGATQNVFTSSVGRNPIASSSNLLDSSRRYQTTLDDAPVSTGFLLSTPAQHVGMRRAYSGNQTPTSASTSHLQTPPSTTATRARRRRQSTAGREDSSRPASRTSGTSRPDSALSFNESDAPQPQAPAPTRSQDASEERPPRSRTESAPAVQRRSQNAFARASDDTAPASAQTQQPAAPQTSLHRQNVWNDITEADPDDLPPPFPEGAPRPPTPPLPPTHSEAANDAQLIGPQPHARIPNSPPPPFISDDEDDTRPNASASAPTQSQEPTESDAAGEPATVSRSSSRASTSSASASGDESVELTEERRAWEADIQRGLSFEIRMLREQQRRVARERAAALKAAEEEEQYASAEEEAAADEGSGAVVEPVATDAEVQSQVEPAASEVAATTEQPITVPATEAEASDVAPPLADDSAAPPSSNGDLLEQVTAAETNELQATSEQTTQPPESEAVMTIAAAPTAPVSSSEPSSTATPAAPSKIASSQPETLVIASQTPAATPSTSEQPRSTVILSETDISERRMLANEPRLGLPPMPMSSSASTRPVSALPTSSSAAPRRVSGHRKTNSDTRPADAQAAQANASRASLGGLIGRRLNQGQTVRGHDSDSYLPLTRRPEDTLYVISAPPPATHGTSSSEGEGVAQQAARGESRASMREDGAASDASSEHAALGDDDDGAESDSSIEQWLAEAAAFDALRKREEEAAARLQALREPPVSDSDQDDQDGVMPGAFSSRPPPHRRQVSAARKVPDPANLALMDQALPKAPPSLVLGRSRGGAAFSDSSSDSTDTDELLDQYSSSDEDDDQHRAFREAAARNGLGGGAQTPSNDPFVNSHKSVHARNTSSAPNLSILDDSDEDISRSSSQRRSLAPVPPAKSGGSPNVATQAPRSDGPTRSLSLKAKGKLPERDPASTTEQADSRAGDFEEDTSSSRDISDAEDATANRAGLAPLSNGSGGMTQRGSTVSLTKSGPTLPAGMPPPTMGELRTSIDPLLQPLGYGRTDLGNRLKGLFGQSLVGASSSQVPASLSAHAAAAAATQALPSDTMDERRSLSDSRRLSSRPEKEAELPIPSSVRRTSDTAKVELSISQDATRRDDSLPVAPSKVSTLRRQSSAGSKSTATPSASADMAKASSSSSTVTPEQRARDEALAQIAQISATSQRQDSLAALERLLAKTGRPTSMLPPSAVSRAELGGRLQSATDTAGSATASTSQSIREPSVSNERPPVPPSNRLSRSGAIIRNRPDVPSRGPLPSPPSALSRAASTTRPVSFVNPRSSAAPLPRGRLPAITDATRHFPPSASAAPGVAPSWLSYIPTEERERLPAPLEPQRVSAGLRTPGSRVSAMISRFEAPSGEQTSGSASPTKQNGLWEDGKMTASESNHSNTSNGVDASEAMVEPAVFRRFSRNESSGSGEGTAEASGLRRRPPPPPPILPARRTDTNPFRRSESSNQSQVTSSSSIEALARQIEEAASDWSSEALHRPASQVSSNSQRASLLVPPSTMPSVSQGAALPRSPRTQAMDTLTRREHDADAQTPPMRPPKSPLITPEQILASGSRNGLSASIAAAQAAAFARRDGRESRSHSNSSSFDVQVARRNDGGEEGVVPRSNSGSVLQQAGGRPLPTLPSFVCGLGITGDEGREGGSGSGRTEMPPPLPVRPRDRVRAEVGSGSGAGTGSAPSVAGSRRALPSIPTARSASASEPSRNAGNNQNVPARVEPTPSATVVSSPSATDPATRTTTSPSISAAASTSNTTATTTATSPPENAETEPSSSTTSTSTSTTTTRTLPRREPSLGLTDFDLLVASLDHPASGGPSYDRLSAISDFLGPAKPTSLSPSQLSSLSVGVIECDSRRVTKEGKVKQKLSCVGVRVDKCPICIAQFKEGQKAVILNCGHIMHETCGRELFKRTDRCGVCRASAV